MVFRLKYWAVSLVLVSLMTSCISFEPIHLNLQYDGMDEKRPERQGVADQRCGMPGVSIIDARSNTETIGRLRQAPVLADGLVEWFSEGLSRLGKPGQSVLTAAGPFEGKALQFDIAIRRVAVYDTTVRLHATLVLNARIQSATDPPTERLYRGEGDMMSWTGSKTELLDVLNLALTDVLKQIKADLLAICSPVE